MCACCTSPQAPRQPSPNKALRPLLQHATLLTRQQDRVTALACDQTTAHGKRPLSIQPCRRSIACHKPRTKLLKGGAGDRLGVASPGQPSVNRWRGGGPRKRAHCPATGQLQTSSAHAHRRHQAARARRQPPHAAQNRCAGAPRGLHRTSRTYKPQSAQKRLCACRPPLGTCLVPLAFLLPAFLAASRAVRDAPAPPAPCLPHWVSTLD